MKSKPIFFWKAEVEIETESLGIKTYTYKGKEAKRETEIIDRAHQSWIKDDNIVLDVGKRLKGWFKECEKSTRDLQLQYGISISGETIIPIYKLKGIEYNPEPDRLVVKDDLPFPFQEAFSSDKGQYVISYYYEIQEPIIHKVTIHSMARKFPHESAKQMLELMGQIVGVGDGHGARGTGKFKLLKFEVTTSTELSI